MFFLYATSFTIFIRELSIFGYGDNMKALIMAAGKGTRMLPLTQNTPKVLIPVNGKPFLHYVIEHLKQAGVSEFGIIVGYLKEQVAEFVRENNINATIIVQTQQKGTGHALMQGKDFCNGEDFIACGGDNLWSVNDFKSMIGANMAIGVLVKDDSNNLIEIKEKPKEFVGNLINTGLYKFTPEIFVELEKIKESSRGEYELTDAITSLAQQGKISVIETKDYWLDLGCLEDIPKVEKYLKDLEN
jgi:bifunctional UDP-N-acetylglucosamine pyrophosphorylase/glucosamine-1-phosphate N-acetyltransferase